MTVKLSNPQLTTDQVAELVVVELRKEGFVDIGDPGPEETDGKLITHVFEGPEGIIVSIRLDMVNEVPIRISQNGETFSSSADRLFDTISGKLEARWPGSVVREPK